jgi:hypothetical protein
MKAKIISVIICMLFLATAVPAVTSFNSKTTTKTTPPNGQPLSPADWIEMQKLLADDGQANDLFGYSVSTYGDYALIGASGAASNQGAAYMFVHSGTSWTQQAKLVAADGAAENYFAYRVSLYGDTALIGAFGNDFSKGAAYVFVRSGASWDQEAKLVADDASGGDDFGCAVSVNADTALIGAYGDDSSKGSAYVFVRSGTAWEQEAKLVASDPQNQDQFGFSVAVSGDNALVGASGDDSYKGSAYVFTRTGSTWNQQAKLVAGDGSPADNFGGCVSLNGESALIGAKSKVLNKGAAYVFLRTGTTWNQQAKLLADDGASDDQFGSDVSLLGDMALIGAIGDDNAKGSAYIFTRADTTWTQQQKLDATDGAVPDLFGGSVSLSDDFVLIGAFFVNSHAGAAYVFKQPVPDLDGSGTLSWTKVKPGKTVTGELQVANVGDPDSELSWTIESHPDWGTWSFSPSNGQDLTPQAGPVTINVTVVAPSDKNTQFTGQVKIVNTEDSADFKIIQISLKTPLTKQYQPHPLLMKLLVLLQHLLQILHIN